MHTTPRLLLLLFILPLLATSGCSPDARTAGQHEEETPSLPVDKGEQAGLLTTVPATTQQLAAARPALTPEQEAARQLVVNHRGALALTGLEAARAAEEPGSTPALKAAAVGLQQRTQPFTRQLQLWHQRHRPRS